MNMTSAQDCIDAVAWNEEGLVPVIAQDHRSGRVLMLAWMDRSALRLTLEEGRAVYYSRSRQRLWRKGEESGHVQKLIDLCLDCDGDVGCGWIGVSALHQDGIEFTQQIHRCPPAA